MHTHDIESFGHFHDVVIDRFLATGETGHWVFRGHSKASYDLVPSLARLEHIEESLETVESNLVRLFKRHAVQQLPQWPDDNYNLLAIAQHHGVPTRLLDWTNNVHTALFFAVSTNLNDDGAVIALTLSSNLRIDREPAVRAEKEPWQLDRLWKFIPDIVTPRMQTQEGLFTIHNEIDLPLDKYSDSEIKMETLHIPKQLKKKFVYLLYRLGVHRARLFPGIDGLGAHIKWMQTVSPEWLKDDA